MTRQHNSDESSQLIKSNFLSEGSWNFNFHDLLARFRVRLDKRKKVFIKHEKYEGKIMQPRRKKNLMNALEIFDEIEF